MTDEGSGAVEESGTEATAAGGTASDAAEPTDPAGPEPAGPDHGETPEALPGDTPKRRLRPATAGVAAALVALMAASGFLGWQVWKQRQLDQARNEAQDAAVSYAQVLTSIDSDNVDENFKQVIDGATGEFKDMYSKSSVELRQLLIENKAAAHGVIIESAVQSISEGKAVVLLFVDQSVANAKLPDPRIDRSRMKMTLEKVEGRWRASKIELP